MTRCPIRTRIAWVLLVTVALPAVAAAQTPAPDPTAAAAANGAASAAEESAAASARLNKIRRALGHEPQLNLDEERLRFYTSVSAKTPMTFAEYAKGYDLRNGPTKRGNPMTHQEFLNMVTPRELYGSGGITASEVLQFALTNYLGQALIRRGLEELKAAKTETEAREIRARIDRELAAFKASGGN